MLEVQELSVFYGESQALFGVSLSVAQGELVTVIGANGAGKTTLMRAIMGLVKAKSGRVLLGGEDILRLPAHARSALGIGYIPEGRRIFPELSVEENLRVGALRLSERQFRAGLEKVYEMFPRLRERRHQAGGSLSGGEQQMLAIGRALVSSPRLLLVDEISMGLMPILVQRAFAVIRDMHREGLTVLLVEQNARQALSLADRGYVLETGRIVLQGTAEELREHAGVRKAYLGG